MKKINKTPLAAALGAAFISTFAATAANAEANPFGMTELSSGYMQLAEADTKSAEMACGASMGGMAKPKAPEGACAGNNKPATKVVPSAGAGAKTTEGSCGDMMKDGKMKPGMEAACGAMMKGKEGACGEMMKGESMKGKEGACGDMKKDDSAKGKEGACGDMMKGKEGACGDMKAPAAAPAK
ncbi:MAG: hypothetical protein NTV43_04995 [Methylococcales bacterium]|nr:hypothetical protein [Methylococcales bacterium]